MGRKKIRTKESIRKYHRQYEAIPENKERRRRNYLRRAQEIKYEVLAYYSQGAPKCAQCGEADIVVLCLDHVDGSGAQQRKQSRVTGTHLYYRLRRDGFPAGFQVLCCNCNVRKQFAEYNYLKENR